ncbi:hypothetical protein CRV15_00205 [Streptomyces clavuligerus]|nr:hypothetical protein D1794_00205 [Streptomyces clavuligerus]QCS04149.1 hypothetical protein CRV15_00205 [Streptomyces clavuligerus]
MLLRSGVPVCPGPGVWGGPARVPARCRRPHARRPRPDAQRPMPDARCPTVANRRRPDAGAVHRR